MMQVFDGLQERGIIVDERKPDVIRAAPLPLYNTFEEVWNFVQALKEVIDVTPKKG